jgi:integrase
MVIKVKLRRKPISGNKESLYLDYYPPIPHPDKGEPTRREFLKLYLYAPIKYKKKKGKDGNVKKIPVYDANQNLSEVYENHNNETLPLAEMIRQKRENELNKPEVYSVLEKERLKAKELGKGSFIDYFKMLADKKNGSDGGNWLVVYKYLKAFTSGNLKFYQLDEKFCEDFKAFLLSSKAYNNKGIISQNSAVTYFTKFKAALKQAFKDKKIPTNIAADVAPIQLLETQRNYLTLDELNSLVKTPCTNPILKKAALFSALTGMRASDIKNLTWSEIKCIEGTCVIHFTQQKTKGVEVLPIPEQAFELLGEPGEPSDKVFQGFVLNSYHNRHLFRWLGSAGITKDITFHCFRHTYATLQLSEGTSIYTVSKMLGHRNIKTTQIYSHLVDKLKQEATNRIKLDM